MLTCESRGFLPVFFMLVRISLLIFSAAGRWKKTAKNQLLLGPYPREGVLKHIGWGGMLPVILLSSQFHIECLNGHTAAAGDEPIWYNSLNELLECRIRNSPVPLLGSLSAVFSASAVAWFNEDSKSIFMGPIFIYLWVTMQNLSLNGGLIK